MSEKREMRRSLRAEDPLHVRLTSDIKRRLEAGDWLAGTRLPTEAELSADYGVSRPTVRTSMKLLEAQGLVHIRHGAGTFVTSFGATMVAGLQELRSTTETIRQQGFEPRVDCRLVEHRLITPEAAEAFAIPPTTNVIYLERSIRADGRVVAYCYEEIVDGFIEGPFDEARFSTSIFDLFQAECGFTPAYASTEIHAANNTSIGWGADRPDQPLYLLLKQAHFSRSGEATIYSRNYFVENVFNFSVMRVS